ncbi:MAG: FmdC precursor [Cytophagales bacterium]|nr:FmdC precursor [Cytophagales bacterium]
MSTTRSIRKIAFGLLFLLSLSSYSQNLSKDTFGKGLTVTAKDSSFNLKMGFRFQTLYSGVNNLESKNYQDKMLIRRSRLKFDGFAFDPSIRFKIELGLSNRDQASGHILESGNTSNTILDAVVKWQFANNWSLWFGQTKLPGNRERLISSQKLQFVDRSLINSKFNIDRGKGIQLHHKCGTGFVFKQALALSIGEGRNIIIPNPSNGHEVTGRLEFLPLGEFKSKGDYFGADLMREPSPKLAIGLAADFNGHAVRERGVLGSFITDANGDYVTNNLTTYFVDLIFKHNGYSVMSEYASRSTGKTNNGFATGNGLVIQTGYLLDSNWEFAGRLSEINGGKRSTINNITEYTFGISRYVVGHNLKIQSDFSYQNIPSSDNLLIFRFQTELAF